MTPPPALMKHSFHNSLCELVPPMAGLTEVVG